MLNLQSHRIRLGALALCLGLSLSTQASAAPAKGKGKGKKPVIGAKNSALSNALNDKGAQVQKCAAEHALDKGAKKAEMTVRVTINKGGEVVDTHIEVKVDGGDKDKVEECVEKFVRSAKFPAVPTPLATAERSWTVAVQ